ncbi:hypothetical protein BB559_000036 [Furculomyces boomerangus]|uniref:Uncharacterized protein n=1 Tax=Furculomyces boomerangus TaxID=61424 RepID=A0A2T9Z6H8_9FUNG|nr:hypothetical protein BB559_000036 [Furculomyces boomerangus]
MMKQKILNCTSCNYDLVDWYDEDSNSCINCGIVNDVVNIDFGSSEYIKKVNNNEVYANQKKANVSNSTLLRWGWNKNVPNDEGSAVGKQKQNKKSLKRIGLILKESVCDNGSNEIVSQSQDSEYRQLNSHYYISKLYSIKKDITVLGRLLFLQGNVDRAFYLANAAFEKRLKNKKFLKLGNEGKIVGSVCLYIAARESGYFIELHHISTFTGKSVYELGSMYKKIKDHLKIKLDPPDIEKNIEHITSKIYHEILYKNNNKNSFGFTENPNDESNHRGGIYLEGFKSNIKEISCLAIKIVRICKLECLDVGKNTLPVLGASVIISIFAKHFSSTRNSEKEFRNNYENMIQEISRLCFCSIRTIKENISLLELLLVRIQNEFVWYFGYKIKKQNAIHSAEKIIDAYMNLKPIETCETEKCNKSIRSMNSKENTMSSEINVDGNNMNTEMSFDLCFVENDNPSQVSNDSKDLNNCIDDTKDVNSDEDHQEEGLKSYESAADLTNLINIQYPFDNEYIGSEVNKSIMKKRKVNCLFESKSIEDNLKSGVDVDKKRKFMSIGKNPKSFNKAEAFRLDRIVNQQQVSEEEICIALFLDDFSIESIISLPTHTLYDIFKSRIGQSHVLGRDLDDPQVDEHDISTKELDSYLQSLPNCFYLEK